MEKLLEIIERLLGPGGCPWDQKQTVQSLRKYMEEESQEVLAAVDSGDEKNLCEELGDLLFNIVFMARVAPSFGIDDVVEKICEKYPLEIQKKTAVQPGLRWDVLILDTLGELAKFYALSDAAFVGGSLVAWGGHNLLEPAYYAKPVFFGPHMDNFAHLAEIFVEAGAARIVKNHADLVSMFSFPDEQEYREMGHKAKSTLLSLQGATEKTIQAIDVLMNNMVTVGGKARL